MLRFLQFLAPAALLAAPWARSAPGQSPPASEYQLKAAFLFNFARFVEWPAERSRSEGAPIIIGILGEDPFGEAFGPLLNKTISGRPLAVRRFTRMEEIRICQVLFVSSSHRKQLPRILEEAGRTAVLTVGETDSFAERGGMIQFLLEDNKVRFEVNVEAADKAGLKISSKVLTLARRVWGQNQGAGR